MNIKIITSSQIPIYQQIKNQIQEKILSSEWKSGTQLPSIRALAKSLQVGIITTTKAYDELVVDGFIISHPGKGFFVCEIDLEYQKRIQEQLIKEEAQILLKKLKGTPLTKEDLIRIIRESEIDDE